VAAGGERARARMRGGKFACGISSASLDRPAGRRQRCHAATTRTHNTLAAILPFAYARKRYLPLLTPAPLPHQHARMTACLPAAALRAAAGGSALPPRRRRRRTPARRRRALALREPYRLPERRGNAIRAAATALNAGKERKSSRNAAYAALYTTAHGSAAAAAALAAPLICAPRCCLPRRRSTRGAAARCGMPPTLLMR